METSYETGKQPCDGFKQLLDGNAYATWGDEHLCYRCGGLLSFCENCHHDHHNGGYETCNPPVKPSLPPDAASE